MTEKQKEQYIDWLCSLADAMKVLKNSRRTNIEGLYEYAGTCNSMFEVHLDEEAFAYAIESLDPTITERDADIDGNSFKFRSFILNEIEFFAMFKKGE